MRVRDEGFEETILTICDVVVDICDVTVSPSRPLCVHAFDVKQREGKVLRSSTCRMIVETTSRGRVGTIGARNEQSVSLASGMVTLTVVNSRGFELPFGD